jgi:hypothetical protein
MKKFIALQRGYRERLIDPGETFSAPDDFTASWAAAVIETDPPGARKEPDPAPVVKKAAVKGK